MGKKKGGKRKDDDIWCENLDFSKEHETHPWPFFTNVLYVICRDEDPYAEDAAALAQPEESEEAFAQRASAFNALANEVEDEEEDG